MANLKRKKRPSIAPPHDALVQEVAVASTAYFRSRGVPLDEVRMSEAILGRIFDACPNRAELEALNQSADAGLTSWIPDAAVAMWKIGRGSDGAALIARLGRTLGFAPFPTELLEGVIEGVARWCTRDGDFEIDLTPDRLARLLADLGEACPDLDRLGQLGILLDRDLAAWREQAEGLLADAGAPAPAGLTRGDRFAPACTCM